jgi:hypothetical protein
LFKRFFEGYPMATWQLPPQGWCKPRESVAPARDWRGWRMLAMQVMNAAAARGRRKRQKAAQQLLAASLPADRQVGQAIDAAA